MRQAKFVGVQLFPAQSAYRLLTRLAALVMVVDVVTKALAVEVLEPSRAVVVVNSRLSFTVVRRFAPAWTTAEHTWVLSLVLSATVVSVLWWGRRLRSRWWAAGAGILLGGVGGDLLDRILRAPGPLRGAVIDFVVIDRLPICNVAEVAVFGSALFLIALSCTREAP